MFCNLDSIDVVSRDPRTGRERYHQTDHRLASEIEQEPELSALFALTRVFNAVRLARNRNVAADVYYECEHGAPLFLHRAVVAAGGQLSMDLVEVPYSGERSAPADIADQAFRALGERVRGRMNGQLDEELLIRLEDETLSHGLNREVDPNTYWMRLLELAAVCGEILRARTGGTWLMDAEGMASVPFVFRDGQGTLLNAAGKAERFLERGEPQRPSFLVRAAGRGLQDFDRAPLLVVLKPAAWTPPHLTHRPLLPSATRAKMPAPNVFLVRDLDTSFAYVSDDEDVDVSARFDEALANLRPIEPRVEELDIDGGKVLLVTGHFYAAEKLLDQEFMRVLGRRLGATLLAAGVPHRGLMIVTAVDGGVHPTGFLSMCEARHQDCEGEDPISPVAFLVCNGEVQGFLRLEEKGRAERPGVWRKLLNWLRMRAQRPN